MCDTAFIKPIADCISSAIPVKIVVRNLFSVITKFAFSYRFMLRDKDKKSK